MPRIYVVAEYSDNDTSGLWVIDLDKCPKEHPYTQALEQFSIAGTTIAPEISLTHGTEPHCLDYDDIKAELPAFVEGTIEIYIDENLAMPDEDDEDTSDDGGFENEES